MEILHDLLFGFSVATLPMNLLYCFLGVLVGTLVGVLPGVGPPAALSLLLPATFHVPPVSAVILLAGIMYGAMYGGSTTSILVNIPGEAASVITCLDGYQMARKGRAGPALGISAFGSFIAGTISIFLLIFLAPTLANFALRFGPPEYFSLMVLGLSILVYLARGSIVNALIMVCFGLLLGTIGLDQMTGSPRFIYKITTLMDGVGLVQVVIGLFGVSEVFLNVERTFKQEVFEAKIKGLLPNWEDWKRSIGPIGRGTIIGFFLGVIPGMSVVIPTFVSYTLEKKISKYPEKFGTGMIEGVAGPESANNAASCGNPRPHVEPRHPDRCCHGIVARGPDDSRTSPGSPPHQGITRGLLGRRGEPLRGQCHAPCPQSPPDQFMGQDFESAIPFLVSPDSAVLYHWFLCHE